MGGWRDCRVAGAAMPRAHCAGVTFNGPWDPLAGGWGGIARTGDGPELMSVRSRACAPGSCASSPSQRATGCAGAWAHVSPCRAQSRAPQAVPDRIETLARPIDSVPARATGFKTAPSSNDTAFPVTNGARVTRSCGGAHPAIACARAELSLLVLISAYGICRTAQRCVWVVLVTLYRHLANATKRTSLTEGCPPVLYPCPQHPPLVALRPQTPSTSATPAPPARSCPTASFTPTFPLAYTMAVGRRPDTHLGWRGSMPPIDL